MKILSIGNSFSQDAHKWLHKLAADNGLSVDTVNLYIGGCSLEQHWQNTKADAADYDLEHNGGEAVGKISICQALQTDRYDVVTLQQASHFSGIPESYSPYITELAALVRRYQPTAKIYFHQTWTYEKYEDPTPYSNYYRQIFANYGYDQEEMYRKLLECSNMAAELINADIIPVGTVVHRLRQQTSAFHQVSGGIPLSRDGYHLSWDYGRYAAAAVWLYTLTGTLPNADRFEGMDPMLLKTILQAIPAN